MPNPSFDEMIDDYLRSVPALLGYVPDRETALIAISLSEDNAAQYTFEMNISQAQRSDIATALIDDYVAKIPARCAVLIVLIATYPNAVLPAQPATAPASVLTEKLTQQGNSFLTVVIDGFTTNDHWLIYDADLDTQSPLGAQLAAAHPVLDWREAPATMDLALSGQRVAAGPEEIGLIWSQQQNSEQILPIGVSSAIIAVITIAEGIAHGNHDPDTNGMPVSEYSMPSIAASLQEALAQQPLRGFIFVPLLGEHPNELLRVLEMVIPYMRGLGRSHLLDWAAAAAVVSGDQRNAEAALTAAATSPLADGPTEMGAMLYTALAENRALPVLEIMSHHGLTQLYELEKEATLAIASAAAAAAHRQGHDFTGGHH